MLTRVFLLIQDCCFQHLAYDSIGSLDLENGGLREKFELF